MCPNGNEEQSSSTESAPPQTDASSDAAPARKKTRATKATKTKAKKKRATKKKTTAAAKTKKKKAKATRRKAGKKATKKRRSTSKKPAGLPLPPKSLVLTNADGMASGVLPKHALVMVNRGIHTDDAGVPVGVDPRPTERAFLWLIGRRPGEGLDPAIPYQRGALRVIEYLVRASIMADESNYELVERLHRELLRGAMTEAIPDSAPPSPLSMSDLTQATESEAISDDDAQATESAASSDDDQADGDGHLDSD